MLAFIFSRIDFIAAFGSLPVTQQVVLLSCSFDTRLISRFAKTF